MSKLFYSEQGFVIPILNEELTEFRRARKILELPASDANAILYLLCRNYPGNEFPLKILLNGVMLSPLLPGGEDSYRWYELHITQKLLIPGSNVFELYTDAQAMNSWSLALEDGHAQPNSFVSTDGGAFWSNDKLSYSNRCRGEYVIRLRLDEGVDPIPPSFVWENPKHPRLERLRELLPTDLLQPSSTMTRVRKLLTWVCMSWEYRNLWNAVIYTPWDAETILAWGKAGKGHYGWPPVVMCVHYAVTFITCCMALGIPARCAIFTEDINGYHGHFTGEVWFEEFGKWVFVDPTVDSIFFRNGIPLSVNEVQAAGSDLGEMAEWGPGFDFQMKNPFIPPYLENVMLKGLCYRHRALWPRTDFLSHPDLTPPGHGSVSYCETNLVWEGSELERGMGMFPYFGDAGYFDSPPKDFPI